MEIPTIPTVRIAHDKKRNRWRVHYRDASGGNRKPYAVRYFTTRTEAASFVAERDGQRRDLGAVWVNLPASTRAMLVEAHDIASRAGVDMVAAVRKAAESAASSVTLSDLMSDMLAAKRARGLRERSLNALRQTIAAFITGREKLPAASVTPAMVREWIDSRGWSAVRRGVAQTELSALFRHGIRSGALVRNPCDQIERPIVEAKATTVLTPADAERLFRVTEAQDPDLLGFLALAAFGGFRTESEVQRMTRADVVSALASGVIRPPVENKTRRQRIVPVLPNLRAWLEVWVRRKVDIIPPNFRKRWIAVRRAAGIHPWPQNVLRHSRASYRLADTGDERMTAAEDGHSPDVLVRHYRALVTAEDARAYFSIFPTENHKTTTA